MRMAARSRSATGKDRAEFATGLMIGKYQPYCMMHLRTHGIFDEVYHRKSVFCIILYITRVFTALYYFVGATEDQAAFQMKKDKYKQELLNQIAEQQRRKCQ